MAENFPTVLALDFDGVICDGLIEYFQTAWWIYCQIWQPLNQTPPSNLAENFYRLRPVIETGWEMPILIKALLSDIPAAKIGQDWNTISQQVLRETNLAAADISQKLDQVRDEWIDTDLAGWLSLHRFYPGVVERLRSLLQSSVKLKIITTKEGRFVQQLLQQQDVQMPAQWIIGKESKRPKPQVLREVIAANAETELSLWFVEDRLKTLQAVQQQPDLDAVQLYLADWGYNTQEERESVRHTSHIHLLSLSQFAQEFSAWL
ncbi:MAG: HAD hydrolase-like protein [Chroococcidiopsidaceae cyanobacterium CP_BM_RX_35]|nr:HAD hydrolase-like protein [Chroococcidiopsidaceae cyanobacterium CP_BM_RX_35]